MKIRKIDCKQIEIILYLMLINICDMKTSFALCILLFLFIGLNGNYAQISQGPSGSSPLKSVTNPLYGFDVPLYDDLNQDQRQAGLSVAFNGWVYACYTMANGGFVVVKSMDNGITWDGWQSVMMMGYFITNLDIVVTGETVSDVKVWVAYTCYDLANHTSWFAGYEKLDGDLNYLGHTDLDSFSSAYGFYDIAIASDYRNPGVNCNPFSIGILYSKSGSPRDSLIFYCSTDGGASFGYRKKVSTSSSFYDKVALSYGKGLAQSAGRYFAAWEQKVHHNDWNGNIFTAYTDPYTYSNFTPQENLDTLEGDPGMGRNPSIATSFTNVNNAEGGMTEIVLFDLNYLGNGDDFDLVGMHNVYAASTSSNWVSFSIDNSSDYTIQSDINFSPANNNFLVTYFDSTTQKLPSVWENFSMANPSSWNVGSDGYNDNQGLIAPYPKVEINPILSQTADVWIRDRTNGNGEVLFDAKYSTYDGVRENAKDDEVTLSGVRPNPCNESAFIGFELRKPEKVTITLYDVYGKKERVMTDQSFSAGKFNERINLSGLAGGVYYFTFTAGNFTSSGKITVIR
jgi:hypothetical protein